MARGSWTPDQVARRVASDIPRDSYVNVGIGMPTLVLPYADTSRGIVLLSENGIVGMGPPPPPEGADPDLVDAGKAPCSLVAGAAICDQTVSFAIIGGGRLDLALLGALEVSADGDLASWRRSGSSLGSVGGAMDIAVGAKEVWVVMRHTSDGDQPKIVHRLSHPVTARNCVKRIYTEIAALAVTEAGLVVRELGPGVSPADAQRATEPTLLWGTEEGASGAVSSVRA